MDENQYVVIEQRTVTLPFLDDEVPALTSADGGLYIPVYKVCQALGIRADTHIRRWRRLVLCGPGLHPSGGNGGQIEVEN